MRRKRKQLLVMMIEVGSVAVIDIIIVYQE